MVWQKGNARGTVGAIFNPTEPVHLDGWIFGAHQNGCCLVRSNHSWAFTIPDFAWSVLPFFRFVLYWKPRVMFSSCGLFIFETRKFQIFVVVSPTSIVFLPIKNAANETNSIVCWLLFSSLLGLWALVSAEYKQESVGMIARGQWSSIHSSNRYTKSTTEMPQVRAKESSFVLAVVVLYRLRTFHCCLLLLLLLLHNYTNRIHVLWGHVLYWRL